MKWQSRLFFVVSAGLVAAACQGTEAVPLTPSTAGPFTVEGYYGKGAPSVYVLVVDDANTPEAAALRARAAQALRASLLAYVERRGESCVGTRDPAEWRPGDDRVVIVRASAPTQLSLVTPIDRPALAWTTITSKEEEIDAVVAAATEAMEQRLAMPGETYRPLRAASRALDLLKGLQAPETESETAFVASLAKGTIQALVVASTRDDEDVVPPADLVPNEVSLSSTYRTIVVTPSNAGQCQIGEAESTRLEAWGELVGARDYGWPCDDDSTWNLMLHPGFVDCGHLCVERPIQVDTSGAAACKVHVEQPDLERCDPDKGWRDPGGKEILVEWNGQTLRRCEVVQHEGAALESCRTSPDCPGCASGFCVTDVSFEEATCEEGKHHWPLRFTGGARALPYGRLELTCDTAED
ncbi:hypothetical protein [Polyangium jinanense]|uniref:Lipoprotein n=1 Tax=Polyangium jinanense TaxID=2829994 RepID=A0A9X3X4W1_9BACT|nr:hypothetical protein [Polyangium jinanense]MDC3961128.1 hypothetical protein [Polyangium jinanense]MDC3982795.1 hypothetical protein [Polyangium jinanense]